MMLRHSVSDKSQALFGMCGAWLVCFLLTVFDVLPSKSDEYGFSARTDISLNAVSNAPWFHVPYPGNRISTVLSGPVNKCVQCCSHDLLNMSLLLEKHFVAFDLFVQ